MHLTTKPDLNLYETIHNLYISQLVCLCILLIVMCLIVSYCLKLSFAQDSTRDHHVMCGKHAPFYLSKIQKFLNSKVHLTPRCSGKGL